MEEAEDSLPSVAGGRLVVANVQQRGCGCGPPWRRGGTEEPVSDVGVHLDVVADAKALEVRLETGHVGREHPPGRRSWRPPGRRRRVDWSLPGRRRSSR